MAGMIKLLVEELHADGLSEGKIAKAIGVAQPTVHRIRTREHYRPGFDIGNAIVELHRSHFNGRNPESGSTK